MVRSSPVERSSAPPARNKTYRSQGNTNRSLRQGNAEGKKKKLFEVIVVKTINNVMFHCHTFRQATTVLQRC